MPYKIEKRGEQWVKIKKSTGEVVSHHSTRGKAQMSAYYAMEGETETKPSRKKHS